MPANFNYRVPRVEPRNRLPDEWRMLHQERLAMVARGKGDRCRGGSFLVGLLETTFRGFLANIVKTARHAALEQAAVPAGCDRSSPKAARKQSFCRWDAIRLRLPDRRASECQLRVNRASPRHGQEHRAIKKPVPVSASGSQSTAQFIFWIPVRPKLRPEYDRRPFVRAGAVPLH